MGTFQLCSSGLEKEKKKEKKKLKEASITMGEDMSVFSHFFQEIKQCPYLHTPEIHQQLTERVQKQPEFLQPSRAGSIFGLFALCSPTDHGILNITRKYN